MGKKPTDILLIDKDLTAIEFAINILKNEGYGILTASSMRDALSAINQNSVGMILCGLELEDISGEQLLSYLKKDPLREKIPFIFFLPLEEQKKLNPKRVFQMGAEDLIFFPLDVLTLVSRIREILQPPARSDSVKPNLNCQTAKKPRVKVSKPDAKSSRQVPKIERRSEKRKSPKAPVAVEVSSDGESWEQGVILNTSRSGALIETGLRGIFGETVLLRGPKDKTGSVVSGSVAHVLLGEKNERIGIGVNFHRDAKWPTFCEGLLNSGKGRANGQIKDDFFPIDVEVSREGMLWIDAQICSCDATGAHIKTFMLGKPEEAVKVRFVQHGINNIVTGRIKRVGLEDNKLLAKIELDFAQDGHWYEVFTRFATLGKSENETRPKPILIKKYAEQKPQASIRKQAPQKPVDPNNRFYQSLIGRKMDNYEVVSFISSGCMGGVFKGWDTALERDVALKFISWELSSQKEFVKMFFKEARFVSKFNHPNISQIYYIGNVNGIIYYAMEFVHGQNLFELIKKKVRLQIPQLVGYLKTACNALHFVWKNNIIHRDIKPGNIMVTSDDELKIVDFGVAKLNNKGKKQSESKIVGSPAYLSPEAIRNQKVDHRSDIYSLGATFYHLIAGVPPFIDVSLNKILQKQLNDPLPSLQQKAPHVPDFLCDIIAKMMSKKPDERFQDYQEIIASIDNVACQKQIAV